MIRIRLDPDPGTNIQGYLSVLLVLILGGGPLLQLINPYAANKISRFGSIQYHSISCGWLSNKFASAQYVLVLRAAQVFRYFFHKHQRSLSLQFPLLSYYFLFPFFFNPCKFLFGTICRYFMKIRPCTDHDKGPCIRAQKCLDQSQIIFHS